MRMRQGSSQRMELLPELREEGGRMIGYFLTGCIVGGCVSFIAMCIVIGGSE